MEREREKNFDVIQQQAEADDTWCLLINYPTMTNLHRQIFCKLFWFQAFPFKLHKKSLVLRRAL